MEEEEGEADLGFTLASHVEMQELRRLRELKKLKDAYGLLFYDPFEKQDLFHANGHIKRRFVRTGNRFGKSTLGAAEDCAWAIGERVWYPEGDPRRTIGIPKRPTKGLIIVADWEKAKEIFTNNVEGQAQGKLFKFLPKASIGRTPTNNAGVIAEINVKSIHGGWSTIYLDTVKSFMANPMGHESSDWDWIHIDEPCPKPMWVANSRGLIDRGGSAWFTCTPITEAWINDTFLPRDSIRKTIEGAVMKDDNHWMITGNSYDNPHNDKDALKLFEADLTPEEIQCRIQGIPLSLSGLVYKSYNPDVHVLKKLPSTWESWLKPPEDYTYRVYVDPHPQTPHAVLFSATAPFGATYYWHEIFRQVPIDVLCDMINEVMLGRELHSIIMDPAGFIISPTDGKSYADVFYENGLMVEKAPKDLERGLTEGQAYLAARVSTGFGTKIPKCYISPHLTEMQWQFDHYMWDPKKPNKPIDKDDHMMENFYRSVITDHSYVTQSTAFDPTAMAIQTKFTPNLKR